MRYMMMVKGQEGGAMPPQAVFDAIEALIADQKKTGVLVEAAGLTPTSEGARVRIRGRKLQVIDGPFTEAKEVIGGYSIVNAASREEAIEIARQLMALHIEHWPGWEGECEVRGLVSDG